MIIASTELWKEAEMLLYGIYKLYHLAIAQKMTSVIK
jgi:hypothetical protein